MTRADAKKAYVVLRRRVTEILRDEDPIGLMASGAPADEYDPEIGTILPRLKSVDGADAALTVVHEEFCRWFGADVAGPAESYRASADAIWGAWLAFRGGGE